MIHREQAHLPSNKQHEQLKKTLRYQGWEDRKNRAPLSLWPLPRNQQRSPLSLCWVGGPLPCKAAALLKKQEVPAFTQPLSSSGSSTSITLDRAFTLPSSPPSKVGHSHPLPLNLAAVSREDGLHTYAGQMLT